jgi:AcrR family transcriptional regulator
MARRNGVVADRGEEVYSAALRLFREKGYHATSMQDIAAAVGLYKGSLYHYIGGKEELLVRVFERGMGVLLADVECIAADRSLEPSLQLRRVVEAWRALAGESLANVRAQRERYAAVVSDIVARGVRAGEFAVPDVGIATLGLLGMCNWLCQWYSPGGRLSAAEIGNRFADLILDGLRGEVRRKTGPSA